ncbi:iron-sulfur cluster assembly protein [Candidatus Kapabacteria bacterium]|nr:iron-sulfur cluster assembly protein [Candidatus Kapabacteria bacterium]
MDVKDREKANADLEVKVYNKIKEIFDPEIPVNIYELGLIYDVSITELNEVVVLMTLTAPNCPEAGGIPMEVEKQVKTLEEVKDAKALLTFDPPWDMSMMSEEAKFELGML